MASLHEERKKQKRTLKDMADALDVSIQTYKNYEDGNRKICNSHMKKICDTLNIKAGDFFVPSSFTIRKM